MAIHEPRVHVLFQTQNSAAWQEGLDKWMLKTAVLLSPGAAFASLCLNQIGSQARGLVPGNGTSCTKESCIVQALGVHDRIKKRKVLDGGGRE
ncbi:hypothetical protein KV708_10470 [Comamonas thiooxydans]|uniref:hypothetical protein n=1 Tax=Comamonas thiooxydans TaxID=363952 RepID=UPI0011A8FA5A